MARPEGIAISLFSEREPAPRLEGAGQHSVDNQTLEQARVSDTGRTDDWMVDKPDGLGGWLTECCGWLSNRDATLFSQSKESMRRSDIPPLEYIAHVAYGGAVNSCTCG